MAVETRMSYRYFRILTIGLALSLTLIASQSVRDENWIQLTLRWVQIAGFFTIAAMGAFSQTIVAGWKLRRMNVAVAILLVEALFVASLLKDHHSSLTELMLPLEMLPVTWLTMAAAIDLSGEVRNERVLLHALRWTSQKLKQPVLLACGVALVIWSLFGRSDQGWITANFWISWNRDLAYGFRSYAGQAVYWSLVVASLGTVVFSVVFRKRLSSATGQWLKFAVLLLAIYAAIDASFAMLGFQLVDQRSDVAVYLTWISCEVFILGYLLWERIRFGQTQRLTLAAIALCLAPMFQLAVSFCFGSLVEDFPQSDRFVPFYLGVGLLTWGFGRMQLSGKEQEELVAKAMAA